jgi:hypothetical protein
MKGRARGLASLILPLLLLACATKPEPVTRVTELGRFPAAEALGMTRAALETRLGLTPASEPRVSFAELRDGVVVAEMFSAFLAHGRTCAGGAAPRVAFPNPNVALVFRDDVLIDIRETYPLRGEPASSDVVVTCTQRTRTTGDVGADVAAVVVFSPVLLPFAAITGVANAGLSDAHDRSLSVFRLGAPPSGGLDAYLADLPRNVRVLSRDGDDAEIGVFFRLPDTAEEAARIAPARVFIRDGLVVRFQGLNCVLTTARGYRCANGC